LTGAEKSAIKTWTFGLEKESLVPKTTPGIIDARSGAAGADKDGMLIIGNENFPEGDRLW
jgi:hypothetical protein